MASYTKTFQAEKTYNSSERIYTSQYDYFVPPKYSETLYASKQKHYNNGWYYYSNEPCFEFDLIEIPGGKRITKATLHVYSRSVYYSYLEASSDPFKLDSGWNAIVTDAWNGTIYGQIGFRNISIRQVDYADGYAELDSHLAQNKPYVVVEYEDVPPEMPTDVFPTGTMDARKPIRFSWKYNSVDSQMQTAYTLEYSIDEKKTWTTITQETSNQYHDFDANTFPETSKVYWRVKTRDENGLWSKPSDSYFDVFFRTVIAPQKAPVIVEPTTGYLDGSKEIVAKWQFIGGSDYNIQSRFDLNYTINEGETWETITKETQETQYIFPPRFFQSGTINWKIRTYNEYDEISPYSEIARFNVISSPPLPQIQSVTNSSRPLVTWVSEEQQAYHLKILQYDKIVIDTGVTPSLSKQHKVTKYLQDGTYTAYLKITNKYNLNSNWAEYKFTINTRQDKPPKPILSIYENEYGITLVTTSTGVKNAVYRDNELIGYMSNGFFVDYTGSNNQLYKYFIRSITVDDNFTDSDIKLAKCSFIGNTLSIAQSPGEYIKLNVNLNNPPTKVNDISNQGALTYFVGRQYPVVEYSDFKTYNKQLTFLLQTKKQLSKLIDVINAKQTLIYRDQDGEVIYGIVLGINYEKVKFGYIVNFNINKVDYAGGIDD